MDNCTHTYAKLAVPEHIYDYIRKRLQDAGYEHAFQPNGAIDMHGVAIVSEPAGEEAAKEAEPSNRVTPEPAPKQQADRSAVG